MQYAYQSAYCNAIDSFLLSEVVLGTTVNVMPEIVCNMHIAHCNMHIAIESYCFSVGEEKLVVP
jgi:hypothetical protein